MFEGLGNVKTDLDALKQEVAQLSTTSQKLYCLKTDMSKEIERLEQYGRYTYVVKEDLDTVKAQAKLDKERSETLHAKH